MRALARAQSSERLIGPSQLERGAGQARSYFTDPNRSVLNNLTHLEIGGGYWAHTTRASTWSYTP